VGRRDRQGHLGIVHALKPFYRVFFFSGDYPVKKRRKPGNASGEEE
jgi:hypothetical protein